MHLHSHARTQPDKPALVPADGGESLTFAQLDDASNRSAQLIRHHGLGRGDVIATLFANGPEVFVLNWAAQETGLYVTAISCKLSAADIGYILKDSGARALVVSDCFVDLALAAVEQAAVDIPVFAWTGRDPRLAGWNEQADLLPARPVADENPGGDLLYSSGTTGRPKGVMAPLPTGSIHDHTSTSRMAVDLYGMGEDTVYLSTSPLYHAAPLRWALAVQKLGGTVVLMDRFDAETALRLIEEHRVTHATFVPTHLVRMLKLPAETRARHDVSALKVAIHSAAPCSVPVKRAMIEWMGPIIYEYYSGTECCGVTALDTQQWLERPGSVGQAVLGRIRILDDEGRELPPGEVGNVYFSDGQEFEYLNDPVKTAEAHSALGWGTMGDIGHVDEDGYLYLSDRKAFMIISGGVNIYPLEIENVLIDHPKVHDVAVVGLPDDEMGEIVTAFVHPTQWPVTDEAALVAELSAHARERLGSVKMPKTFHFRNDLPREPTGKMMKRRLIDAERARRASQEGATA